MIALLFAVAHAGSLDALLARGELTLLETFPDGRLDHVTAMARIAAPRAVVWAKLTDWAAYETWMPQVANSTLVSLEGDVAVVDWTIAVVGPNVSFRARYEQDAAAGVIRGRQVGGALAGSTWDWRLTDEGATTLVERVLHSSVVETNWLVRQVEDSNHTLDYGINTATGVIELRGLRAAIEGR